MYGLHVAVDGLKLYKIYLIWHSYGEYGNQFEQKLRNVEHVFQFCSKPNIQFCWKNMHKIFVVVVIVRQTEKSVREKMGKRSETKIEDAPRVQNVIYCVYVTICRHKANPNRQTTKQHHHHQRQRAAQDERNRGNGQRDRERKKKKTPNRFSAVYVCVRVCVCMRSIKLYIINKIRRRGRDLLNLYKIDWESLQYPVKVNFLILSYFSF